MHYSKEDWKENKKIRRILLDIANIISNEATMELQQKPDLPASLCAGKEESCA
jgi:hypothetical protein